MNWKALLEVCCDRAVAAQIPSVPIGAREDKRREPR
jgi:hypothetical protein